jgi:hypothetical protein
MHLGRVAELEASISNLQNAVDLAHLGDSDKPLYLSNLAISQGLRFAQLGDLVDLDNCISNLQMAVYLTNNGYPHKVTYLSNL